MAFGKKYYSSYKSNNNIDYYLEIWVKDYSSSITEVTLGAGGPVITYETEEDDRFSPILSSNCKIPLMVTTLTEQSFVNELRTTYQEKEVYLHLYKATSSTYTTTKPIWSGFLTMDLGSGEDVSFPYEQELIFVDGLALLKEIDFVDFSDPDYEDRKPGNYAPQNMYWGPASYRHWITKCLQKTGAAISGTNGQGVSLDWGFTTAVNWYNGEMANTNQGSDPLDLTECLGSVFHTKDENGVFFPDNTYHALKQLLRHWGARITYWKHEFWIVQIPEYIVDEGGFIDNPNNINSRQYSRTGASLGSQDHLGDTYSTRYEQTIKSDQISKLTGTKYNYLPAIHRANASFLSLNGENHYGGFPYLRSNSTNQSGIFADVFQGTINNPSSADYLWVSIPLNWKWSLPTVWSNVGGYTSGWYCRLKFNLYCTQKVGGTITTYYLQYNSSNGSHYWVDSSNWTPLGTESPRYIIRSFNIVENDYVGFSEQIEFVDSSGSALSLTGEWDFYIGMEHFGSSSTNPGSFYCNIGGFGTPKIKRNPTNPDSPNLPNPTGLGSGGAGIITWTNSLQDNSISFWQPGSSPTFGVLTTPSGYNTGSHHADHRYSWRSPLKGFLQALSDTANSTYGFTNDTVVDNSTNTQVYGFGQLIWGDAILETARGNLNVWNGSAFVSTKATKKWGRGTLTGQKSFTQMLIDEFLTGQIEVIISPTMRLAVGEQNKNQTGTASGGGSATRPRYVNPIGRLREDRVNETDPEYFFRRGSFHTLYDEWDYEGYEIRRDSLSVTTTTNDIGSLGGSQNDNPIDAAKVIPNINNALMSNSPIAYIRTTVPSTGSNVIVNGNFNVATGWTLGSGWSIDTTAKKAKFTATGSTSDLTQSVLTTELTYQINFTVEVTAGSLLVKAGSSGTTETITASGDYSIYLDCEGSSVIKFQAGTTFTGTITHITAKDQKSLTSLPINTLASAVFKTNDTLNLINSKDGEIMTLNVSSNQGASDDTISVTSTPLFDDIAANSVLLINQDDLSSQYQNKTKGTVGGFDITATSIDSGSVAISSYIDDDTFGTASATSLATSESIKAYVDTQVGSADTLQEVTDNGNTTTNSIMIGSSSSPSNSIHIYKDNNSQDAGIKIEQDGTGDAVIDYLLTGTNLWRVGIDNSNGDAFTWGIGTFDSYSKMLLKTNGNLGIGLTNPSEKLSVNGNIRVEDEGEIYIIGSTSTRKIVRLDNTSDKGLITLNRADETKVSISSDFNTHGHTYFNGLNTNVGIGINSPTEKLHVVGDALITGDSHADAFKPAVSGNPIKFKNFDSSTEFARITDSGNLLINRTSDAGSRVQVGGEIRIYNANFDINSDGYGYRFGAGDCGIFHTGYNITFKNYNGSSLVENMRLTSNGHLLLGTTVDSGYELDVTGTFRVTGLSYFNTQINANYGVKFTNGDTDFLLYNNTSDDVLYMRDTTNGAMITTWGVDNFTVNKKLLVIDTTASSTAQKFHVGRATNAGLTITDDDATVYIKSIQDENATGYGNLTLMADDQNNKDGYISFNGISGGERARITSAGNLLIGGTTDNGNKLDVTGDVLVQNSSAPNFKIYRSGTGQLWNMQIDSSGRLQIKEAASLGGTQYTRLQIDDSGEVDIYNTLTGITAIFTNSTMIGSSSSPEQKLHVDGGNILLSNSSSHVRLYLRSSNSSQSIIYFGDNDSSTQGRLAYNNNGDYMYFNTNASEKMRLTSGGNLLLGTTTDSGHKLQVAGDIQIGDGDMLRLGDSSDLKLYHSGTGTVIQNAVGNLTIQQDQNDGDIIFRCDDGAGGTETYFYLDGSASSGDPYTVWPDNSIAAWGTGVDLRIQHTGTTASIFNTTGHLQIINYADDKDIIFQSDNGSGGVTTYITLDGSQTTINLQQNVLIGTTSNSGGKLYVNSTTTDRVARFESSDSLAYLQVNDNQDSLYISTENQIGSFGGLTGSNSINFNISLTSGNAALGGTPSAVYKLDVVGKQRVQSVLELEDVLTLNAISTPSDPANNKSSIYMDSSGDIKVKINVEGTVVTRTLASFE